METCNNFDGIYLNEFYIMRLLQDMVMTSTGSTIQFIYHSHDLWVDGCSTSMTPEDIGGESEANKVEQGKQMSSEWYVFILSYVAVNTDTSKESIFVSPL